MACRVGARVALKAPPKLSRGMSPAGLVFSGAPLLRLHDIRGDLAGTALRPNLIKSVPSMSSLAIDSNDGSMNLRRGLSPPSEVTAAALAVAPSKVLSGNVGADGLAEQEPTGMTIQELIEIGGDKVRRVDHAAFIRRELRLRIVKQVRELRSLPLGLPEESGVQSIIKRYTEFVAVLDNIPSPSSWLEDLEFQVALRHVLDECADDGRILGLSMWAMGPVIRSCSTASLQVDAILQRFFTARCGTRLLATHHLESANAVDGFSGAFEIECNLSNVTRETADNCMEFCADQLGDTPEVIVENESSVDAVTCVPSHVAYILSEVIKNSCRAVVERQRELFSSGSMGSFGLDPVVCRIKHGESSSTVTVSDRGGGMSPAMVAKAWKFMQTSCEVGAWTQETDGPKNEGQRSVISMAGYGLGLPMSRLYARYFGGDLQLSTQEGSGTDAIITFNRNLAQPELISCS
eukprot:TRINITY_DN57636_c0_g1_i1.p1 TRINITY_DN57636_c0_g1~~TRINITY_DN57636_c0_g1_i1.p1  ORF type:complete len:463 (-),score=48.77 TRINITY_DN57636_c0_g1_i1:107-1495(-)